MSKIFESKEHELFETFLIKEKEQAEIEKIHGQETIKYLGRCFAEQQKKANIFTKIRDFFYDIIDRYKLNKIKLQNKERIDKLSNEELCNKCMKEKIIKQKGFQIHISLNRIFENKHMIADCGGISYPYLCYQTYMQIEFCEILTQKHYLKEFENIKDATKYFNELNNKLKNLKVKDIISTLEEEIDAHCDELKDRINYFKND